MNRIYLLSLSLILSLMVSSCKRTGEGETSSWESNGQMVMNVKQKYPQFQNAVEQQFQIARTQWTEAQKLTDEEQKINAMSSANALISSGFIGTLGNMESQKNRLRDLQDKLRRLSGTQEVSYRASSSISECSGAMSMIDMTLARGAQTPEEAENVLQILKQSVDNTISHGNDVITYANDLERKKQQDEKEKQQASSNNNTSNTNTNTSTENTGNTSSENTTCSYCGTVNSKSGGTCSSCKAPL